MYGYETVFGHAGRWVAVACALVAFGWPAQACAEVGWPVPTAQAVAMEAEFLADPAEPPPGRAAVCMIDSGVADEAVGEFAPGHLTRYAMQDGEPVTDTHAGQHGTWMARYMGAALDGSGMVGIWPGVEIISVRALVGDGQGFPYQAYKSAIDACVRINNSGAPVVAISLSLGGTQGPSLTDQEKIQDVVAMAGQRGISVFAAVGNDPGPVLSPAREPGIVGVGAGDMSLDGRTAEALCAGTAGQAPYSSVGLDIIAAGCGLQGATPDGNLWTGSGSSQATAMAAVIYAAARAYSPSLSGSALEGAMVASSRVGNSAGWLSARRLFEVVGIDWRRLVRPVSAEAVQLHVGMEGGGPSVDGTGSTANRQCPKLRVLHRRKTHNRFSIEVSRRTLPPGAVLYARALSRGGRVLRRGVSHEPVIEIPLPRGTRWVDLRSRRASMRDSDAVRWAVKPSKRRRRSEFGS